MGAAGAKRDDGALQQAGQDREGIDVWVRRLTEGETWQRLLASGAFADARRRVLRQLGEALLYEGIVTAQTQQTGERLLAFAMPGLDASGERVTYTCCGERKLSFGRVKLTDAPIRRITAHADEEADDPALFLRELAACFSEEATRLAAVTREIGQTLLHDAMARFARETDAITVSADDGYDELEGDVNDGHPYHPSYKSRIGFTLHDNIAYSPDFKQRFRLLWLAVRREQALVSTVPGLDAPSFWRSELGERLYGRFEAQLSRRGEAVQDYAFLPVHPWQWRERVATGLYRELQDGTLLALGEGYDAYTAQQSIRTLSNRTDPRKPNVKLSLGIENTSSLRHLEPRHVRNGPIVSARIAAVIAGDDYLHRELGLIALQETIGVSLRYDTLPPHVREQVGGSLGALWRQSVHTLLDEGEQAVPYTALTFVNASGLPLIDPWVRRYGAEPWLRRTLETTLPPLLHLVYAHGVAVEAHAQNLVLLHRSGVPVRLAVRDFSGGVLFCKGGEADPSLPETNRPAEVRDVVHNALFFMCLTELCYTLERHYAVSEATFWRLTAETIDAYQRRFPALRPAFAAYDMFSPTVEVALLAKRRLIGGLERRDHEVPNALASFAPERRSGAAEQ